MIKISLIIPCFNAEPFLRECLESVFRDDFINECEVIAIDDGSSDNTASILKDFALKHENFVIISQKNSGASAARNAGLKIAKGEFIAFLDSDDELVELKTLYELAKHTNADIAIGEYFTLEAGIPKAQSCFTGFEQNGVIADKNAFFEYFCSKGSHFAIWAKLYNKAFLMKQKIEFLNGVFVGEDVGFNALAFYHATKIAKSDEKIIKYRLGTNNQSKNFKENHFKDAWSVAKMLEEKKLNSKALNALILRLKYEAALSIETAPNWCFKGIFRAIFSSSFALLGTRLKAQFILASILRQRAYNALKNIIKGRA